MKNTFKRAWQKLPSVANVNRVKLTAIPEQAPVEMSGLPDRRVAMFPGERSFWNQRSKPDAYEGLRNKN